MYLYVCEVCLLLKKRKQSQQSMCSSQFEFGPLGRGDQVLFFFTNFLFSPKILF